MQNIKGVPIEFRLNSLKITPLNKQEKYKTTNYLIYETNYPQFHIKIFRHPNPVVNMLLKNSSITLNKDLVNANHNPIKIYTAIKNQTPEFWGLLTESHNLNFTEMIRHSSHIHDFDIFKFLVQMVKYLQCFKTNGIQILQLNGENIVLDHHGNFQLTNIDESSELLQSKQEGLDYIEQFFKSSNGKRRDSYLAPEIVTKKSFSMSSLVWDLGILLLKAFTGLLPTISYSTRSVDLQLNTRGTSNTSKKVIMEIIKGCLEYDTKSRFSLKTIELKVQEGLAHINKLFSTINTIFLKDILKNVDTKLAIESVNNMISDFSFKGDQSLLEFNPERQCMRDLEPNIRKLIKVLMRVSEPMNDEAVRVLIKMALTEPTSIIDFYQAISEGLGDILYSQVKTMKILLLLHSYIFKGSKNTLLVKSSASENAVNTILQRILCQYGNQPDSIIFRFSYFLLVKFNFHIQSLQIIENSGK